jgi:hypothetical protein
MGRRKSKTHLSPLTSITYASTPPGILTSTLTSTRENALNEQKTPPRIFHGDFVVVEPKNQPGVSSTV